MTGAVRIRRELDPSGIFESVSDVFPPKPKRMRWRTYEKKLTKLEKYEMDCDAFLAGIMSRMLKT